MRRIDIKEAAQRTGLSVSALRRGACSGRFQHIRAGGSERGKILFDPALLSLRLREEELAWGNQLADDEVTVAKTPTRSYLADVLNAYKDGEEDSL